MAVYAAWAGFKEKKVSKDVLTAKHTAITHATCKVTAAGWIFEAACSIFFNCFHMLFLAIRLGTFNQSKQKHNNTCICLIFDLYESEITLFSFGNKYFNPSHIVS